MNWLHWLVPQPANPLFRLKVSHWTHWGFCLQLGSGIGAGASWHTCFCTHLHSGPPGTLSISVYGIGKQYSRSPSWSHLLEKRNLFMLVVIQRKILNYKQILVTPTYIYYFDNIKTKISRSKCILNFQKTLWVLYLHNLINPVFPSNGFWSALYIAIGKGMDISLYNSTGAATVYYECDHSFFRLSRNLI